MPQLGAEALATGAARGRVGIFYFEPAIQRVDVIQFAAGDVKGAFWIDDYADPGSLDQDVAISRAILQIHFVLQTRATSADDCDPQNAAGPALFAQQRGHLCRRAGRQFDQPLVTGPKSRCRGRFRGAVGDH